MSDKIVDNGGSAFPAYGLKNNFPTLEGGMTLRDWFAGMTLQGLCTSCYETMTDDGIARTAYGIADAMLKARNPMTSEMRNENLISVRLIEHHGNRLENGTIIDEHWIVNGKRFNCKHTDEEVEQAYSATKISTDTLPSTADLLAVKEALEAALRGLRTFFPPKLGHEDKIKNALAIIKRMINKEGK